MPLPGFFCAGPHHIHGIQGEIERKWFSSKTAILKLAGKTGRRSIVQLQRRSLAGRRRWSERTHVCRTRDVKAEMDVEHSLRSLLRLERNDELRVGY